MLLAFKLRLQLIDMCTKGALCLFARATFVNRALDIDEREPDVRSSRSRRGHGQQNHADYESMPHALRNPPSLFDPDRYTEVPSARNRFPQRL
jgi:hypothetical protein